MSNKPHINDLHSSASIRQSRVGAVNPFPGLRSFVADEDHLFFGREDQVDEILRKLSNNKFVTVMGYSGSGKSSIVYCGVIPKVRSGFIAPASGGWSVIISRPGNSPLHNLVNSLKHAHNGQVYDDSTQDATIAPSPKNSSGYLADILSEHYHTHSNHVLLFIDQFEELFRYASYGSKEAEEAKTYADFIIEACRNEKIPVYVAITMRSDYIGECARYPVLTRLINESNYLVPRMTRRQKKMAIEGPVALGGGKISSRLLGAILDDVGNDQNQLPIMQHALMRTWDYWLKNSNDGEPLDVNHYSAIGRIEQALSRHADEIYNELSLREKEIAEVLFKALSGKEANGSAIRRQVRLGLVAELAETKAAMVIDVAEQFRAPGRSFLMPPQSVALHADSILEISHESLIRIWSRLKLWVDEEFESAQMYLRLSGAAAMYQIGRAGLWRPPDLQIALNWQKKQQPTLAWARRYDEAFERAIVFLDTSRITYDAGQRNKEMLQQRLLKRARAVAIILGTAAVISILFFVYAFTQSNEARRQALRAETEKTEAERQTGIAKAQKNRADTEAQKARKALAEAQIQKQRAQIALLDTEEQRKIAEQNAAIAQRQTNIATRQTAEANLAKEKAEAEYLRAEKNFNRAQTLLFQTTAQAMAVKSLAIEDADLKGLLAQQAKLFFDEYNGRTHDPYIYSGLYHAYTRFKGENYNTLTGLHRDAVRSLAVANDKNIFYSTDARGNVMRGNFDDNTQYKRLLANTFSNRRLAVSPDVRWLAVAGDSSYIQVIDLDSENVIKLNGHSTYVNDMKFIGDQSIFLSAAGDKSVRKNSIPDRRSEHVATTSLEVKKFVVSDTGKWLIGATTEGILLSVDLQSGTERNLFDNKGQPIHSLAFMPDRHAIILGDERGSIRIIDVSTGVVKQELPGHKSRVSSVALSRNGKLLASGSFDGSIQLWETDRLDELPIHITDGEAFVQDLAFSPDSEYIIAAFHNGDIRLWPTDPAAFSREMCRFLGRNMDAEEWDIYVGEDIEFRNTCVGLSAKN